MLATNSVVIWKPDVASRRRQNQWKVSEIGAMMVLKAHGKHRSRQNHIHQTWSSSRNRHTKPTCNIVHSQENHRLQTYSTCYSFFLCIERLIIYKGALLGLRCLIACVPYDSLNTQKRGKSMCKSKDSHSVALQPVKSSSYAGLPRASRMKTRSDESLPSAALSWQALSTFTYFVAIHIFCGYSHVL